MELLRYDTQNVDELTRLGGNRGLRSVTIPPHKVVNMGHLEEIIPVDRYACDSDKKAKIGTQTDGTVLHGDGSCFKLPTGTVGVPRGLNILRPVCLGETIGGMGSEPALAIGGREARGFLMRITSWAEDGQPPRRGKQP